MKRARMLVKREQDTLKVIENQGKEDDAFKQLLSQKWHIVPFFCRLISAKIGPKWQKNFRGRARKP